MRRCARRCGIAAPLLGLAIVAALFANAVLVCRVADGIGPGLRRGDDCGAVWVSLGQTLAAPARSGAAIAEIAVHISR
ncbi:hypothetical protein GCM10011329_30550 [Stakelama pacifica]|nr:hypothetical protein GCM10011329_30550 [Stakelama pacifica]